MPPRTPARALLLTWALASASCAKDAGHPSESQPATHQPTAGGEVAHADPQSSVRALGSNATFADLVRLARSLASGAERDSSAGCLLERDLNGGYALAADLMLALERMPDPPSDLGALMEGDARPIALLTAFGPVRTASVEPGLALASFTSSAPSARPAVVLALDHDRAFVRTSEAGASEAGSEPMSSAAARAAALATGGTLFVSASASTPLGDVHALLAQLPAALPVAFAVLLPPGTALPSGSSAPLDADVACPSGLPDVAEDAPLGDLDPSALPPAVRELQAELAPCLSAMSVERARVVLALRIAGDGSVAHGCLLESGGLDARAASCVVLSARSITVATPSPPGFVDLHLPLALHAEGPAPQRGLCK